MPDLADGESIEMKGSGAKPYVLKNVGASIRTCPPGEISPSASSDGLASTSASSGTPRRPASAGAPAKPVKSANGDDAAASILSRRNMGLRRGPVGWWMSEKLDGVRAYWDGKQFLSRLGNLFHAPDWFVDGLPDAALDGEL